MWQSSRVHYTNIDTLFVTQERVHSLNQFAADLHRNYFERISRVASYLAISSMADYEIQKKKFFNQTEFGCYAYTVPVYGAIVNLSWVAVSGQEAYFSTYPDMGGTSTPLLSWTDFGGQKIAAVLIDPLSDGRLHNVTFRLRNANLAAATVSVTIRELTCGVPGPKDIGTSTQVLAPSPFLSPTIFSFSDAPSLSGGTLYFFVLNSTLPFIHLQDGTDPTTKTGLFSLTNARFSFPIDSETARPFMKDNYIDNRMQAIVNFSKHVHHVNMTYQIINYSLYQNFYTGPWSVIAELKINYTLAATEVAFKTNKSVRLNLPIRGLEDPYIAINSQWQGDPQKTSIINNIMLNNVSTDYLTYNVLWDYPSFVEHLRSRTYKYNPNAPSYLMRFVNDTSGSSCCGIESLIWLDYFPEINMTYIDYCFWSGVCEGSHPSPPYPSPPLNDVNLYTVNEVTNTTFFFLIDLTHAGDYNILDNITLYTGISGGWG